MIEKSAVNLAINGRNEIAKAEVSGVPFEEACPQQVRRRRRRRENAKVVQEDTACKGASDHSRGRKRNTDSAVEESA